MKIRMNSRTKLRKRIHDTEGVADAYTRTGHKEIARGLRQKIKRMKKQLAETPVERDDGIRFIGAGWVK